MRLGKNIIINFDGKIIQAVNDKNELTEPYANKFPNTLYPQQFANYIKDASAWTFSAGMDFVVKGKENHEITKINCKIELWNLINNQLVWEKRLSDTNIGIIRFIDFDNEQCILVAGAYKAYIISQNDGGILREISYSEPKEIDESYYSRFDYKFVATQIDYNDDRRWLACTDLGSRRVRIYSIDSPNTLVSEINSERNPRPSIYGGWIGDYIKFNLDGDYLIVKYEFSGRLAWTECRSTEIYDINKWQICWFENKPNIYNVSLSPDGKMMALQRDKIIEIGEFKPNILCNLSIIK
ncbi:MAG: hypothetical protein WAZ60_09155 [Desulfosalsimonadaceae bacterium]